MGRNHCGAVIGTLVHARYPIGLGQSAPWALVGVGEGKGHSGSEQQGRGDEHLLHGFGWVGSGSGKGFTWFPQRYSHHFRVSLA